MADGKLNLQGVSETLVVPVYARALESQRNHPKFVDYTAVNIVKNLDYDFAQHGKSKMNMWGCASRTFILDREVKAYIKEHPKCTVINMACGLDDRFSRVDNGFIKWYNIDFQQVIDLRDKLIPENERVTDIARSITDFSWMSDVEFSEDMLIVAEGILMYLEEKDVKELFDKIAEKTVRCTLLLELMSNCMVERQKMHDTVKRTGVKFIWGINESEDFTELCPDYKITGDFNLTDIMKTYAPIRIALLGNMLRKGNNRIGRFVKK